MKGPRNTVFLSLSTKRSGTRYRKTCQGYSELNDSQLCKLCQYLIQEKLLLVSDGATHFGLLLSTESGEVSARLQHLRLPPGLGLLPGSRGRGGLGWGNGGLEEPEVAAGAFGGSPWCWDTAADGHACDMVQPLCRSVAASPLPRGAGRLGCPGPRHQPCSPAAAAMAGGTRLHPHRFDYSTDFQSC